MPLSIVRRVAAFVVDQASKTIQRPSRLLFIPLYYCFVRTQQHFPRFAAFVSATVLERWPESVGGKTFCLGLGSNLLQRDHPAEAWQWLSRSLRMGRPSIDEYLLGAMCLYHGLGRFRDAMALLTHANEIGLVEVKKRGLEKLPYRVLDNVWARHIGHIATIDYVIKLGILEGRKRGDTILYLPRGSKIANRFLLQQVAAHIRVVEDPAALPFDASAVQALHYDYLGPRLPDGTTLYFSQIAKKTYKQWHADGKGPLFTLPPEIEERGWAALHGAGIPRGAWFVALHVREGIWVGRNVGLHGGLLNADIATYIPAIEEVTRRGGWVIRMGDPGMTPLPSLANVIDYCNSDLRADWMDVFIAARCRFMVGTSSGPAFIPPIYGVASVLTNWWPPAERAWHPSDIFIPKMPRRIADGKYLTLGETLSEPFSWCHSRRYLADHEGVYVEDNDPEMIRAAVEEMFRHLDREREAAEMSDLRSRADKLYESHGASGMGRLSQYFLRRYEGVIV